MTKGEKTRRMILSRTAGLFNTSGYYAASLSEIMDATGLQKGGLYNHFSSKEEMLLQAFRFNVEKMGERFAQAEAAGGSWKDRLKALLAVSLEVAAGQIIPGGCPLLKAGLEADRVHPPLAEAAAAAVRAMRHRILRLLREGQKAGEWNEDPESSADFFLAALEGGMFLAKVSREDDALKRVLQQLNRFLDS